MLPPITIVCIGQLKKSWLLEGCTMYTERLQRSDTCTIIELKDSKQTDIQKKKREESTAILQYIEKCTGFIICCDEQGTTLNTMEFKDLLEEKKSVGTPCLFIIGGAYGFTKEVEKKSTLSLRLTDLTLPHEICRLLLLEQLYRCQQIMRNTGYHHL